MGTVADGGNGFKGSPTNRQNKIGGPSHQVPQNPRNPSKLAEHSGEVG